MKTAQDIANLMIEPFLFDIKAVTDECLNCAITVLEDGQGLLNIGVTDDDIEAVEELHAMITEEIDLRLAAKRGDA